MKAREIVDGIHWVGAVHWDRRIFDSLLPLPDGTTYNAYLVQGAENSALIDTVEPGFEDVLFARLDDAGIEHLDYVVSNHAEQDHSGSLPAVLERFPDAKILCTPKAMGMLRDLMPLAEEAFHTVGDGETVDLGDRSLRFVHFPWVHWPETMLTYVPESRTLFPCDLFGCHIATNELIWFDQERVHIAAKQYYAQIMMPFRKMIQRNLAKVDALEIERILPSHGPIHAEPETILEAYRDWTGDAVRNLVVLPYISMHHSTQAMVDHLVGALTDRGIRVERFDLVTVDISRLASALVDAATVVIGTPTVAGGPHPNVAYAAFLANIIRPKARFASVIGSYGWGGKAVEQIAGMLGNLKVEILDPVLSKGRPSAQDLQALDRLADSIAERHRDAGVL